MVRSSEVEQLMPAERELPLLESTRLRQWSDIVTENPGDSLVADINEDPELLDTIARIESAYAGLTMMHPTQSDMHRLINTEFADEAISVRANYIRERSFTRPTGNPDVYNLVMIGAYLDRVLPISEQDTVTPLTEDGPRRFWVDHFLARSYELASKEVGINIESTVSDQMRENLAKFDLNQRRPQYLDGVKVLGGTALIALSETVAPENWADTGAFVGAGIGLWGVCRTIGRWSGRSLYNNEIKRQTESEELGSLLPVIELPHGFKHALDKMRLEYRELGINCDTATGNRSDLYRQKSNMGEMLRKLNYIDKNNGFAYVTAGLLRTYKEDKDLVEPDDYYTDQLDILEKYFPIDQTKDTITPQTPGTGQKSWHMYVTRLAQDRALTKELAKRGRLFF